MFTQQELAKVLQQTVPPDRTNAIVGYVDKTGMSVVVKMTKDEHWEIEGVFKRDWSGQVGAGAKVIFSW